MSTYEISKSSLLSLKAEIYRKREELKSRSQDEHIVQPKKLNIKKSISNKGVEQRALRDISEEDQDLLLKSRLALEAKAKLYDKLLKRKQFTEDELERNRLFLVRFDRKKLCNELPPEDSDGEMDFNRHPESDEEGQLSDEYEPPKNPDEEWVEYTDCLGRTRTCMRKDLELLKNKDADFRASIDQDENKAEQLVTPGEQVEKNKINEKSELLSTDMRRELLRQQWEDEEIELMKKDNLHYQDILFNEARTHGVGYYAFSKDEEERTKQQEALKNLRVETEQEQKKAQDMKAVREKQLAARLKAARNRKRARMGLPPEEDEPEIPKEDETSKPNDEDSKPTNAEDEIEQKLDTEKEKEKEKERKKHIRPWDIGKEGVRKHQEYTQEEWVDKKRKERPKEFAPPCTYKRDFRGTGQTTNEHSESDKMLYFSTKGHTKNRTTKPDLENTETPKKTFQVRNPYKTQESYDYCQSASTFEPNPIVNECIDFDDEQDQLLNDYILSQSNNERLSSSESDTDTRRGEGVEIAPPPTFDYYGPSGVKKSKSQKSGNLKESISAGLKYLRNRAEKREKSTKHDSEMFIF